MHERHLRATVWQQSLIWLEIFFSAICKLGDLKGFITKQHDGLGIEQGEEVYVQIGQNLCIYWEIYTPYADVTGKLLDHEYKVYNRKIKVIAFVVKFCS